MSKQTGSLGIPVIPQTWTASKHVSEHNQILCISNSWPLCIQVVSSTSTICIMETRYKQHNNRCNATVLEQNVSICFPPSPFNLISRILKKVCQEEVKQMIIHSYTDMANTTLLSSSVTDVNAMPTAVDATARSIVTSSKNKPPLVQNRKLMLAVWKVTGNPLRW